MGKEASLAWLPSNCWSWGAFATESWQRAGSTGTDSINSGFVWAVKSVNFGKKFGSFRSFFNGFWFRAFVVDLEALATFFFVGTFAFFFTDTSASVTAFDRRLIVLRSVVSMRTAGSRLRLKQFISDVRAFVSWMGGCASMVPATSVRCCFNPLRFNPWCFNSLRFERRWLTYAKI